MSDESIQEVMTHKVPFATDGRETHIHFNHNHSPAVVAKTVAEIIRLKQVMPTAEGVNQGGSDLVVTLYY